MPDWRDPLGMLQALQAAQAAEGPGEAEGDADADDAGGAPPTPSPALLQALEYLRRLSEGSLRQSPAETLDVPVRSMQSDNPDQASLQGAGGPDYAAIWRAMQHPVASHSQ